MTHAVSGYGDIIKQQSHSTDLAAAKATGETAEEKLMLAVQKSKIHFCGALCIGFDTESQGFASALVRVVRQVTFYSALLKVFPNFTGICFVYNLAISSI